MTTAAIDTEFYRAFAERVRETLATVEQHGRTVTVRLLDAPGASATLTCPSWCTDDHAEDIARGTFAEDFAHRGDESALMVPREWDSKEDVLLVQIHQYPFGKDMREPTAILWPTLGLSEVHLGSNGVWQLADQLRQYAGELDRVVDDVYRAVREHKTGVRVAAAERARVAQLLASIGGAR
jgi:hypothetical protein